MQNRYLNDVAKKSSLDFFFQCEVLTKFYNVQQRATFVIWTNQEFQGERERLGVWGDLSQQEPSTTSATEAVISALYS